MRFLILVGVLTAVIGACSSYERAERQEQQAVDSFDSPIGDDSTLRDPWGNQPR